jgi:hypothetical protein
MNHADKVQVHSCGPSFFAPKLITSTLSEADILFLHEAFLTNGIHEVTCSDKEIARKVIQTILGSLPMYTSIACLTLEKADIYNTFDVHSNLLVNQYNEYAIENFFVDIFYFDCMWIEITTKLLATPWYQVFCANLEKYQDKTPILKVYIPD